MKDETYPIDEDERREKRLGRRRKRRRRWIRGLFNKRNVEDKKIYSHPEKAVMKF